MRVVQGNIKTSKKSMKIANIYEENLYYLQIDLRNFTKVFRKDVTYDNIKRLNKSGHHSLSRRYIFGKNSVWVNLFECVHSNPKLDGEYVCNSKDTNAYCRYKERSYQQ